MTTDTLVSLRNAVMRMTRPPFKSRSTNLYGQIDVGGKGVNFHQGKIAEFESWAGDEQDVVNAASAAEVLSTITPAFLDAVKGMVVKSRDTANLRSEVKYWREMFKITNKKLLALRLKVANCKRK